jgi:hypothetical protein
MQQQLQQKQSTLSQSQVPASRLQERLRYQQVRLCHKQASASQKQKPLLEQHLSAPHWLE